jgi:peptidoglycan-associated lipoprotein
MTADNSFGSNPGLGESGGSSMDEFGSKGQANIGNGSTGSFSATDKNTNSYDGESAWGSPDGGNGSDVPDSQIARMENFQETSNLQDIHFNFDQYGLDSNSKEVLKQNASYLKQNLGMKIEIQGHCDERGTNNYNIALGERRAHSTKRFLVSQGIDSSRISIISFGEEKPFCFDSNEGCWFQNRRAHFMLAK